MTSNFIVHVVDDDDAVRDALAEVLDSVGLPAVAYANGNEFLDKVTLETNGCLVSDIRMPGISGMELQKRLQEMGSDLPIIFITGHADVPMAVEALQRGAVEFIQKPFREQELLDIIQTTIEHAKLNHEKLHETRNINARLERLSKREREVLELISEGYANKVIAANLGISQRTVENHRAKLLEKMHVKTTAGLIKVMVLAKSVH